MTVAEWGIVAGVVSSALLAFGPWMFMVHARLAVLVAQVARIDTKVDKLCDAHEERLAWCVRHQSELDHCLRRLEAHDVRLSHLTECIEETR
ncbi:MAG: hypothetical protein ACOY3P_16000 [Planctomycetota bacterium]